METPVVQPRDWTCWSCLVCAACSVIKKEYDRYNPRI
ncbi:Thuricin17 [Bacillus thuringiensis]|uniref:Thuricin17 n=1 Tax=Bacillus thuringiensis TaxID=1428 RepID=A0A1C4E0H3_BACTU|nr:Thuricin17 [Bacillus thuringiensis]